MNRSGIRVSALTAIVVLLLAAASARGPLHAQGASLPFLLELRGELVSVRYTPGALDRATGVEERFGLLAEEMRSWTGRAVPFTIYLLSAAEWSEAAIAEPWGLPGRSFGGTLALPAWGTPEAVALWRDLLGGAPPELGGAPMRDAPEEGASLAAADLVGEAAIARMALARAGFRGDRPWVEAVTGHLAVVSVFMRHEPQRLPEVDYFYRRLAERGGGPAALPLDAWSRELPIAQRLWFEARFFDAARRIAASEGKSAAKAVLKRARKNGDLISAGDLVQRYPSLGDWLRSDFGARPEQ